MPSERDKTRRRRFLQISLRTLLVLLTVGCVWLGWKVNKAQKQRAAVAWVEEMGGRVWYDCQTSDFLGVRFADPPGPDWLEELVGIDYLSSVDVVNCEGITTLTDVSPLKDLTGLYSLWLIDTSVGDLRQITHITSLSKLALANSEVSELSPLANLNTLEFLGLSGTEVKDLEPLETLKNLRTLQLDNTRVSDLAPLASLTNLSYLDITNTNVKDLNPLLQLTNLRHVYLSRSISEEDVLTLREAMPYLYIEYDGVRY